jgi:hypothetical protein
VTLVKRTTVKALESAGHTEIKAVRSIEIRGMISTSSSEAMSSSSGGVTEFRKERGNAMVCGTGELTSEIRSFGQVM